MQNFKVHGFQATLASGLVQLTAAQAEPRMQALKLVKRIDAAAADPKVKEADKTAAPAGLAKLAVYEVTGPINFKRGEEFAWDGKPSRLQESQQFDVLRKANELLAAQEAKRVEKRQQDARKVRAPR